MSAKHEPRRVRSLFLSDIHLGTKGCQAEMLISFLREWDADTIYLVGDVVDGWRLRSGWYWPQAHNDVVQKLLRKVRKGARLIYVPGNHDEFLRDFLDSRFGGIEVHDSIVHVAADGRRYLVLHGDQFDFIVRRARWLALMGDGAYAAALAVNTVFNALRRRLGLSYWSLSAWAKLRVKNAVAFIGQFEDLIATEARRQKVDGVICGHIHHAAQRDIGGIAYINTGDWVESCTAIVEDYEGCFTLIRWAEHDRARPRLRTPVALPAQRAVA